MKFDDLYNIIMEQYEEGNDFLQPKCPFTVDHLYQLLRVRNFRTENFRDEYIGNGDFRLKDDADANKIVDYINKTYGSFWAIKPLSFNKIYQYVFEDYKLNGCWTEGEIDKLPSQHNGRYPTPIEFAQ